MDTNQIFAWGGYDDNPNNAIGVDTLHTQKEAKYNDVADSVFTGSVLDSFFTNNDKTLGTNPASVVGEEAKEIVFGEGLVDVE